MRHDSGVSKAATLTVHRSAAIYRGRLVAYRVLLDDKVIGSVRNGDSVDMIVPPGPHRLRLRVMGKYSSELQVDLAADEMAQFDCGPRGSVFDDLYNSCFRRNEYIRLTRRS